MITWFYFIYGFNRPWNHSMSFFYTGLHKVNPIRIELLYFLKSTCGRRSTISPSIWGGVYSHGPSVVPSGFSGLRRLVPPRFGQGDYFSQLGMMLLIMVGPPSKRTLKPNDIEHHITNCVLNILFNLSCQAREQLNTNLVTLFHPRYCWWSPMCCMVSPGSLIQLHILAWWPASGGRSLADSTHP